MGEKLSEDVKNMIKRILNKRNIATESGVSEYLENLYLNSIMYAIQYTK